MIKRISFANLSPRLAFLLLFIWIGFSGCAKTSDPEKSGGEILAITRECDFRISGDGKWLLYAGEQSPYHQSEERWAARQRESFLVDLETGEHYPAEPDAGVRRRIAEGLGPDGLGCFSPDHSRLYFRTSDWGRGTDRRQETTESQNDASRDGATQGVAPRNDARRDGATRDDAPKDIAPGNGVSTGITTPGRQVTRYHYVVDLTQKPFVIRETDHIECSETPDAVKPDIVVRQVSDKRIELHSRDGRKLASHRPAGRLSKRIGIGELHDMWATNQWERDYSLSPDGNRLAYRISETGLIGFSAPTRGYLLDLSQHSRQGPEFLAASVYAMQWDRSGNFYACTSHSKHRTVIVRWDAGF